MGHFSVLIQLAVLQLLIMVCKLGGSEKEPSYATSVMDFRRCKDSNLATFWENAVLLRQANGINTLSKFYMNISESDLNAQVTHQNNLSGETVRHCKLLVYYTHQEL